MSASALATRSLKDPPSVCRFNVEGDTAFVGVQVEEGKTLLRMRLVMEEGRQSTRLVSLQRLQLDYVCSVVGEQLGGKRTGDAAAQLYDAEPL